MVEPLHEVLARSAYVSLTATLVASVIGIGLGTALGLARVPGRGFLTAVVNTGMAVPTVVVAWQWRCSCGAAAHWVTSA